MLFTVEHVTGEQKSLKNRNWPINRRQVLMVSVVVCIFGCIFGTCAYKSSHVQVRGSEYRNSAFGLSHHGGMLVFTDDGDGGSDLYTCTLPGVNVSSLARTPEYESSPTYSPDDKEVVYSAGIPNDNADHIFVRSVNGSRVQQVTSARANDKEPSYEPNGLHIIFARNEYATGGLQGPTWSGYCSLYITDRDGKNVSRLTPDFYDIIHPQYATGGKSVMFTGMSDSDSNGRWTGDIYEVTIVGAQAGKPMPITHSGDIEYASIANHLPKIVGLCFDGTFKIMDLHGNLIRQIGTKRKGPGLDAHMKPAFSADDTHILFLQPNGDHRYLLYETDLAGRRTDQVFSKELFSDPLDWR